MKNEELVKQLTSPSKNSRLEKFGKTITFLCLALIVFIVAMILLFVAQKGLATFFVNNKIEDSKTAFRAEYSSSNRSYNFDNISNLMQEHIKNNPEKDMVLLLVPVDRVVGQSQNYYGQTTYYTAALNNYLLPSGVKLLKTQDAMKIVVTTTDYK